MLICKSTAILLLLVGAHSQAEPPWVDFEANTPYTGGYLFEYGKGAFPDYRYRPAGVACLVSSLKKTGLFSDLKVQVSVVEGKNITRISITPTYVPGIEDFIIGDIVFQGFERIDERKLRENLSYRGFGPRAFLLKSPPSYLLEVLRDAADAMFPQDSDAQGRVNEILLEVSFRIRVVGPGRVELTIISGASPLCPELTSASPKVGRITVLSPHNNGIIFEYAGSSIPEGGPLTDEAVNCLVSQLKATGIFIDVGVQLKPGDEKDTVDVTITPVWASGIEGFVIDEILFENFRTSDQEPLRAILGANGIRPGVALLRYPLSEIKRVTTEAVLRLYENGRQQMARIEEEELPSVSSRIVSNGAGHVTLTILAGYRKLCE